MSEPKSITLWQALLPVAVLVALLACNILYFGDAVLDGPNQFALVLSATVCGVIGWWNRVPWERMLDGILRTINTSMSSMLILILIGCLSGGWVIGGVIPTMIYYGIDIMNPSYFLVASLLLCSIVSLATGSSWSTIATVGVAIIGIGRAFGINEGIVAGAIISGAYFGDKMSPLSDTTNLAPAVAGTDLFTHIRYLVYTTLPTYIITTIIFACIGIFMKGGADMAQAVALKSAIAETYHITPWLLLAPALLIFIIVKRVPAMPAMLIGTALGVIGFLIFQGNFASEMIASGEYTNRYQMIMSTVSMGIELPSNDPAVSELLSSGGMAGMLPTVWLILSAMIFAGMMEACGALKRITDALLHIVRNVTSLVGGTLISCIIFNLITGDQYLSIVVSGNMMKESYKRYGLAPEVLSRALEDSATVTSPLIPWNSCGATQARVLGVPTVTYFPYSFFCLISPFMNFFMTLINYKIRKKNHNFVENE